jgi:hypothetical protein
MFWAKLHGHINYCECRPGKRKKKIGFSFPWSVNDQVGLQVDPLWTRLFFLSLKLFSSSLLPCIEDTYHFEHVSSYLKKNKARQYSLQCDQVQND